MRLLGSVSRKTAGADISSTTTTTTTTDSPPAYFDVSVEHDSEALPSYNNYVPLRSLVKIHDGQSLAQQRLDSSAQEYVHEYVDVQPHLTFPALATTTTTADAAAPDIEAQIIPPRILDPATNVSKRRCSIVSYLIFILIFLALWACLSIYYSFFFAQNFCTSLFLGQVLFFGVPVLISLLFMGLCHSLSITGYYKNAKGVVVAVTDKKKHRNALAWWVFIVVLVFIGLFFVRVGCRNGWYGDDRGNAFGSVR